MHYLTWKWWKQRCSGPAHLWGAWSEEGRWLEEQLIHNTAWAGLGTACCLLLMSGSNPFGLLSFISLHWKDFSVTAKYVVVIFLSLGLRTCWQSHFLSTATLQLLNAECCHITSFSDRAFQVSNFSFNWWKCHDNFIAIALNIRCCASFSPNSLKPHLFQ